MDLIREQSEPLESEDSDLLRELDFVERVSFLAFIDHAQLFRPLKLDDFDSEFLRGVKAAVDRKPIRVDCGMSLITRCGQKAEKVIIPIRDDKPRIFPPHYVCNRDSCLSLKTRMFPCDCDVVSLSFKGMAYLVMTYGPDWWMLADFSWLLMEAWGLVGNDKKIEAKTLYDFLVDSTEIPHGTQLPLRAKALDKRYVHE